MALLLMTFAHSSHQHYLATGLSYAPLIVIARLKRLSGCISSKCLSLQYTPVLHVQFVWHLAYMYSCCCQLTCAQRHADLSSFEPALRLNGASNGEGATVRISAVTADLPLDPRHPAVLQAVEVGLPHAALLRNLANNALRRAAAAGDRRALVPGEPYTSPPEVVEAAAVEAILDVGTADMPPPAEEWASTMTEVLGEGEEEEVTLQSMSLEEEEEEWQAMEDREGAAAAAAVVAAAEPVSIGPEPLQLPMPPQLPLYHTAVLQHLRVCGWRGESVAGLSFTSRAAASCQGVCVCSCS